MIIYGNGEVLLEGNGQGFEMIYNGTIRITNSPDNLFLSADKTRIIGVMLDGSELPNKLFNYAGDLRVTYCGVANTDLLEKHRIITQGVDYWELDDENWEDDGSLWGTRDGTYLINGKQSYSRKNIVVNKNIKTQSEGQYQYKDGSPVPANELIHIHGNGTTMTGASHNKDSVQIYPPTFSREKKIALNKISRQIKRTKASTTPSSSGGGGGY